MVDSYILDLKHVNVCTSLLIEEVLLHGIVHFFSSHFVLEIPTNGFVNFVHVRRNVLSSENGGCTKDTHRLAAVVIGIGGVSSGSWIQTVIDGEVPNFVVAGDGFTRKAFVVLDSVRTVEVDQVAVKVVNCVVRVCIHCRCEKLRYQGQTGVLAVN